MAAPVVFDVTAKLNPENVNNTIFDLDKFRKIRAALINNTLTASGLNNYAGIITTTNITNITFAPSKFKKQELKTTRDKLKDFITQLKNKTTTTLTIDIDGKTYDGSNLDPKKIYVGDELPQVKNNLTYFVAYQYVLKLYTIVYIHLIFWELANKSGAVSETGVPGVGIITDKPGKDETNDEADLLQSMRNLRHFIRYQIFENAKCNITNLKNFQPESLVAVDASKSGYTTTITPTTYQQGAIAALEELCLLHSGTKEFRDKSVTIPKDKAVEILVNFIVDSQLHDKLQASYKQQFEYFLATYPLLTGLALEELEVEGSPAQSGGKRRKHIKRA